MNNLAWILCLRALLLLRSVVLVGRRRGSNGRRLYKWVDNEASPTTAITSRRNTRAQEQHVINSQGRGDRAHRGAENARSSWLPRSRKRLAAEQRAARDKNLLNTYASVAEIERLRDQRLQLVADQIKVTKPISRSLNGRMKKLRANGERFRPYNSDPKAPPMSDQIAEDLVRLGTDMRTQQQNLQREAQRGSGR